MVMERAQVGFKYNKSTRPTPSIHACLGLKMRMRKMWGIRHVNAATLPQRICHTKKILTVAKRRC